MTHSRMSIRSQRGSATLTVEGLLAFSMLGVAIVAVQLVDQSSCEHGSNGTVQQWLPCDDILVCGNEKFGSASADSRCAASQGGSSSSSSSSSGSDGDPLPETPVETPQK